jgi:hypothetical protein
LDELEVHLASEHFNCLPYECEHCQFAKFPTEFAVMRHNEQDHGNKNYSVKYSVHFNSNASNFSLVPMPNYASSEEEKRKDTAILANNKGKCTNSFCCRPTKFTWWTIIGQKSNNHQKVQINEIIPILNLTI